MLSVQLDSFRHTRMFLTTRILSAPKVRTERWQGKDVKNDPAAVSYEIRNACTEVPLQGIMDLKHWQEDCAPNLPWADDHFAERVGGEPLNPGVQWANWPWSTSADKHRNVNEQFNHTYMERLWPKWARVTTDGTLPVTYGSRKMPSARLHPPYKGIGGNNYGDLQDLVELLAKEPYTRQAWIPLFFPEDTGHGDGGRKPCTLGYQIMVRDDENGPYAHMYYPLRSCDLIRHYNDDCYMAVRLLIWIIEQCRIRSPFWMDVWPGSLAMHMTSLHIFANDKIALERAKI